MLFKRSRDNYNAVHFACIHGYKDVLERLHQVGCKTNAVTSFGRTALHLSSIGGSNECVQYILENQLCEINQQDQSRSTALHYATANDHDQIVKLLLQDQNIDVHIKNDQGFLAEDLIYKINTFNIYKSYKDSININRSEDTEYYSKYSIAGSIVRPGRTDQILKLIQRCSVFKKQRACLLQSSFMVDQDVISKDDFTLVRQLGTGGFGEVNLVKYQKNGQLYALKIMKKDIIIQRQAEKYIIQERQTLEKVKGHPFMCQLHYAFQDVNLLYLVLEYIQGYKLQLFFQILKQNVYTQKQKLLKKSQSKISIEITLTKIDYEDLSKLLFRLDRLKEDVAKKYIAELVLAIEHLHKKGIIYRDLKPENVLIDIDGHIKLVDYGLVKTDIYGRKQTKSFCGTAAYLSPEMILQKGHNFAVDWYGVGVLTLELLIGENPFEGKDAYKRINKPSKIKMSADAWDFIQQLMCRDPKYRLGTRNSSDVKNHKWFADINWDDVYNKKLNVPKYECMKDNYSQNIQKNLNQNTQRRNNYDDYDFEEIEIEQSAATVQTDSCYQNNQDLSQIPYFYNWSFF